MTEILAAEINSFGLEPKAVVLPSEDPILVLTSSQLQEIISRAIQPLQDELSELKDMVAGQAEEIAALKATVAGQGGKLDNARDRLLTVEVDQDFFKSDLQKLCAKTDQSTAAIGKTSEKRIAEIDKILRAYNGEAPFKLIRNKLGLAPNQFSRLVSSLDKRKYQVSSHPSRPKEKILKVKVRWS